MNTDGLKSERGRGGRGAILSYVLKETVPDTGGIWHRRTAEVLKISGGISPQCKAPLYPAVWPESSRIQGGFAQGDLAFSF